MIKKLAANWMTSSVGITAIGTSLIHLVFQIKDHTATENSYSIALLAVLGGLAAIFAGDANKSASAADLAAIQAKLDLVHNAVMSGDTTMLTKQQVEQTKTPETKL